jgi:DNA helicase-2/ATP-dependent DNA helicase PcrA
MSDGIIPLDDVDITGIEEFPPDASVKLHGPPGTGKTTQSGARVGQLLREWDYNVSDVAWCTYRRELAFDTLRRFVEWGLLAPEQLDKPHEGPTRNISTTHAVANRTVSDLPSPAQTWQKADFCERMGMQFWSKNSWETTAGSLMFRVFEWMRGNCLDPADPTDVRKCPPAEDLSQKWHGDIPSAWNRWEDYKAQRDVIDFSEMLETAISEQVAPTNKVLVVDEYHDATPLMAKLCEQWIDAAEIVIVAGDPHQVVNSFDGADPRYFKRLDLPEVLLDKTYRVPEEHWQAATSLLSKAHDPPGVERISNGQVIEYRSPTFEYSQDSGWNPPAEETAASPGEIIERHGDNTLFLTRMQMQADGVGAALERAGILYYSQSDLNGWNTESSATRFALYNALQKIRGFASGHFGSSYGALSQYQDEAPQNPDSLRLGPEEAASLLEIANAQTLAQSRSDTEDICEELRRQQNTPSLTAFDEWVEQSFWERHTAGAGSVQRLNKGGLSDRDRAALECALARNEEPIEEDEISVGALTIHASKGQEAEDIVVYDGISRRIRREMETSTEARQNEWRTWYVALTRASKRLHIMRDGFRWTSEFIPKNIRHVAAGLDEDGQSEALADGGSQ